MIDTTEATLTTKPPRLDTAAQPQRGFFGSK
jgi:hypothetical protein